MNAISSNSSAPPGNTALIIGATSSLGQSLCREFARRGYRLTLVARDERELDIRAGDLSVRHHAQCTVLNADFSEKNFSASRLIERAGEFDTLVHIAGDMGTSEQDDLANLAHVAAMNYVIPSQILSVAAESMAENGGGTIVVIASVAGDRGRASNYEYGAAKAALATFASGLRNRYFSRGVHVMTVKPGFLDTPMTWGMHSRLIAPREEVAKKILDAMEQYRDEIYVPWFWGAIMFAIRAIPEKIFKRMKL